MSIPSVRLTPAEAATSAVNTPSPNVCEHDSTALRLEIEGRSSVHGPVLRAAARAGAAVAMCGAETVVPADIEPSMTASPRSAGAVCNVVVSALTDDPDTVRNKPTGVVGDIPAARTSPVARSGIAPVKVTLSAVRALMCASVERVRMRRLSRNTVPPANQP